MIDHVAAAAIRAARASTQRVLDALEIAEPTVLGGRPRLLDDPRRGFRGFGDYALAVRASKFGTTDERLRISAAAPTTFGSGISGTDGGFAMPPSFAGEIWNLVQESSLVPLVRTFSSDTGTAIFPVDPTLPWGTVGLIAKWEIEGTALTQRKPNLGTNVLKANKLDVTPSISDELFEDAPVLGAYLLPAVAESMGWKLSDAILNGNGAGQPTGILNSKALLAVAKDGSQATGTFTVGNAGNMLAALLPGCLSRAVWLFDETVIAALVAGGANFAAFPMAWSPGDDRVNGTSVPSIGRLFGRPVVPTMHLKTLGTQGDVVLFDPMAYQLMIKGGTIASAMSLDFAFDADVAFFRFTLRCDGRTKLTSTVTDPKGGTRSPYVAVQARP
jgi:HK97 family phage major capsid protein